MVALMMLHKVLLPIEDAIAAINKTRPVLSCLVHPHLVLFPVRFRLESFQGFGFSAVSTKHERIACLARPSIRRKGGDAHVLVCGRE